MTDSDKSEPGRAPDPHADERAEILLALALTQEAPPGECPSLAEIAAWHEHRLSGPRRAEVEAHVARCGRCYSVWMGLAEAVDLLRNKGQWVGTETPGTETGGQRNKSSGEGDAGLPGTIKDLWGRWFSGPRLVWAGGGVATALAGITALALFLPHLVGQGPLDSYAGIACGYERFQEAGLASSIPERWRWATQPAAPGEEEPVFRWRGATPPAAVPPKETPRAHPVSLSPHQTAFQAGVRNGLDASTPDTLFWQQVREALPATLPSCEKNTISASCKEAYGALESVGRWAALLHFTCNAAPQAAIPAATDLDGMFWTTQHKVMSGLAALLREQAPGSSFSRLFTNWEQKAQGNAKSRSVLCEREAELLSLGFRE